MAEDKPEEKPAATQDGGSGDAPSALGLLSSAIKAALPVVVSAVVSVGFVAFAGKAVLWTRFEALQVPGDQVVKVVPQSEAVAIGASMLLIFGAIGALAALGIYLIDQGGRATALMSRGVLVLVGAEATVAIWFTEGKPPTSKIVATEVVLLAVGAVLWATFVAGLTKEADVPPLKKGEQEPEPPSGPFFEIVTKGCCKKATCRMTKKGLTYVGLIAIGLAAVGYLVALAFGVSSGWRWVVALGLLGAVLLGAVLCHCHRFWKEKGSRDTKRKKAREAEEKRRKEEKDLEAHKAARTAWRETKKRAKRRGKLLARLVGQLRAAGGCGASPTIVVVAEAPPEPPGGGASDGAEPEVDPRPQGAELTGWGTVFTLFFAALVVAIPSLVLHEWWVAVSLGVVALLGSALWRVASLTKKRFVWYGLAVFLSVPLFGTVMLMARNINEPQVQPMALIRTTDGPDESIQGLYVTETSGRVYFANVATEGCENKVRHNSGRLLWVPTDEVVAMALGPLQNVEEAGKAALEMSYDLTPGIETGGATINLGAPTPPMAEESEEGKGQGGKGAAGGGDEATGEGKEGKKGGEESKSGGSLDTRLVNVGPAVRPTFGAGLRIEPETVSPGEEATLRMSKEGAEGFGASREGRNLRLGGRLVDISKEPAGEAEGAEYIELKNRRLIVLGKEGAYVKEGPAEFVPAAEADGDSGGDGDADDEGGKTGSYVKLDDPSIEEFEGPEGSDGSKYVQVRKAGGEAVVVGEGTVTLAGGVFQGHPWEKEKVTLAGRSLVRQAWHPDHIRFHVPDDAHSGVVTVECDQLAGSPLLQVSHAPMARIAVTAPPGKSVLTFNGSASTAGPPAHAPDAEAVPAAGTSLKARKAALEPLTRRWKVDGVRQGDTRKIHERMPPRMAPYTVELTVTDREGNVDRAKLEVLRLPASALKSMANAKKRERKKAWAARGAAREAIEEAVGDERPTAIELDGYTDSLGKVSHDVLASLRKDDAVRRHLLHEAEEEAEGESPAEAGIAVEELGHGDSCPLRRHSSSADLHVDLFLLHQGVVVKPAEGCHALGRKSALWHPPPAEPSAGASTAPNAGASSAP